MNLNQDCLNTLTEYMGENEQGGIFPQNALLCKEWLEAWQRKLHHAVQRIGERRVVVRKGHRLTWMAPADRYCRINAPFHGIEFLLHTQPKLCVKRESGNTILFIKDSELDVTHLDGNVMLDKSIRMLPALGFPAPQWEIVDCVCEVDIETEDPVHVSVDNTVHKVQQNYFPDWDFDFQFVKGGTMVQAKNDLSIMKGAGTFRDMYTLLLRDNAIFPSYLKVKQLKT